MVVLLFVSIFTLSQSRNCYSISLGGGGSFGAYQAGVFSGLVDSLPASLVNYSSLVGISAGSLNCFGISQYPQGSEAAAAEFLIQTWLGLKNSSAIYNEWPGGLIMGLLFHSGLYNTDGEYEIIRTMAPNNPLRKVNFGTLNIDSGLYQSYNESLDISDLQHSAMCSSAIPLMFETQDFNGGVYVDGGGYMMFDAEKGINRCLEETSDESEIFIDVVPCFQHTLDPEDAAKMKSMDVFLRAYEIHSYFRSLKSLVDSMHAFPDVNFRYFIQPSEIVPMTEALNFDTVLMQKLINLGYGDGVNATKGSGNMRTDFEGWHYSKEIIYA